MFLGYSHLQKGYRCYSPDTNHYITSINITFHENTSFFASSPFKHPIISEVLSVPYINYPEDTPARPLQVYHHRPRSDLHAGPVDAPTDSLFAQTPVSTTDLPPIDSLPIAIQKGIH